jgi:hypothetical protein
MDVFYPVQLLADTAVFGWLGLDDAYWAPALNFFIYDTIKIGLLLIVINYVMAVVRYYLPMEKVRDIISRRKMYGLDYVLAAVLGAFTPFCSCSSIPLFIGFVGAGIPLGVTFTFLVASPLINEASLFIFPSTFGLPVTASYFVTGVAVSVIIGRVIQAMGLEGEVNPAFLKAKTRQEVVRANGGKELPLKKRLAMWWSEGLGITKEIFPYVLLGVGLGAAIHGFVPKELVETYLSAGAWWTVPLAVVIGLPLYANSVSVLPIVEAMSGKGVPLGTALAFMTATVTLSVPGLLILKKAIGWRLLLAFAATTAVGIIAIGYLFNALQAMGLL